MHRLAAPAAFALALAACPRAPALRPPSTAEPTTAADLAPAELRVVRGGRVEATLSADGRVAVDGQDFARMEGRRVVAPDGRVLAEVDASGAVRFEGAAATARLGGDGSLASPDGQRMTLGDDGAVAFTDRARPGERVALSTRVEGVTAASRPAAAVLVGVLMFRARAAREGR